MALGWVGPLQGLSSATSGDFALGGTSWMADLEMVSTRETRKEETHKRGGHGEALIFVLKGKRDFRCHVSFDLKVDIYIIYIYTCIYVVTS